MATHNSMDALRTLINIYSQLKFAHPLLMQRYVWDYEGNSQRVEGRLNEMILVAQNLVAENEDG